MQWYVKPVADYSCRYKLDIRKRNNQFRTHVTVYVSLLEAQAHNKN